MLRPARFRSISAVSSGEDIRFRSRGPIFRSRARYKDLIETLIQASAIHLRPLRARGAEPRFLTLGCDWTVQFLFVHQNFPGQYLHVVRRLAADHRHEVTFLSHPNSNHLSGVRKVEYRPVQASTPGVFPDAREFEAAMIRAQSVANKARQLAAIGYKPDVIFGHNGWGEILNLKDIWATTPLIPYFEFFYHERGLDVDFDPEFPVPEAARASIRARNAVNLLGLEVADVGQTPTRFQYSTYPEWTRCRLQVLPEGVDLDVCRPDRSASFSLPNQARRWSRRHSSGSGTGRLLITYVARNLEPYRGFHILMRALPEVLSARDDVDVVIVGGDEVSYGSPPPAGGTWRQRLLGELGDRLRPDRVFFPGKLAYRDYVRLLQVSAVHVYLTYPFVVSWSLREAMACGCSLVASDTEPVREFVRHNETGRLVPFHDWSALGANILALLESPKDRARLGATARQFAEQKLGLQSQFTEFDQLVAKALGFHNG